MAHLLRSERTARSPSPTTLHCARGQAGSRRAFAINAPARGTRPAPDLLTERGGACARSPERSRKAPIGPMVTAWFIIAGLMLILMGLIGSIIERLPLSTGLLYLGMGFLLGPAFAGL